MMMQRSSQYKRRPALAPLMGLAVMIGGLAAPFFMATTPAYAAATSLYLSPSSANVTVNASFNVGVRINAGEPINAVEANLTYNQSQLQFISLSGSGSAFGVEAPSSGGGGEITINRGNVSGVSGDNLVATVTFKALTSNVTSSVSFNGNSQALKASDNSNGLTSTNGGNFNLKAVVTPAPPAKTPTPASPTVKTQTPSPTTPPSTVPATDTSGQAATPPAVAENADPAPSTGTVDDSKSSSKTAVFGISGLAILVIGVATAVVFLRRHHTLAVAPGSYVGDAHTTIFGPSQPVTPVTATPPVSTVVTPSASSTPVSLTPIVGEMAENHVPTPVVASPLVEPTLPPAAPVVTEAPYVPSDRPTNGGPGPQT